MWVHYAKNHSQVCFEIDFSKNNLCGNPSEVIYPENLILKRESLREKSDDEKGIHQMTTKLETWKYEKEVRLLIDIENTKVSNYTFEPPDDENHIFVSFNPYIISKIIFGVNASEEDELVMFGLIASKKMNIEFEKMIIDPIDLKLKSMNYIEYRKDKSYN